MNRLKCPKCFHSDFWKTSDGRLKCKNCRYLFTPKPNPLNIPNYLLEEVISEFILEHSTNIILERVEISKYKLLKLLDFIRKTIIKEFPSLEFKKNLNEIKEPILGISFEEGKVFAEILPIEGKFLRRKLEKGLLPEELKKYKGIVLNGNFHKLEKGRKIDIIEGFWGYLKRKISGKGGIRKERLPLYLAEYSWRYNQRKLSFKEQKNFLLKLISKNF